MFQYIPGCFLNAIENASISTITNVHVGGDPKISISGLYPKSALDNDMDAIFSSIMHAYYNAVERALPGIMQMLVRHSINIQLERFLRNNTATSTKHSQCPLNSTSAGSRPIPSKDTSVDLSSSVALNIMYVY